jgi:hypothetical protein
MSNRIPAEVAFANSASNEFSKWPGRGPGSRLGPIVKPKVTPTFKLEKGEAILTIGSCFARHIEMALQERGYKVPSLAFRVPKEELARGTYMMSGLLNKYTPFSMLNEIEFSFSDDSGEKFIIDYDDRDGFLDAQLHTNSLVSLDRAIERRGELKAFFRSAVEQSRIVIITLGLIEGWWDDHSKVYLNQTPSARMVKKYPNRFFFDRLTYDEALSATRRLVTALKDHGRSQQKILLTVSPVPIQRTFDTSDVIISNTYSKSVLRVVAETVSEESDWVDYYPSYESVMLSDRDTAWEDDLLHVRRDVVNYNVGEMLQVYEG